MASPMVSLSHVINYFNLLIEVSSFKRKEERVKRKEKRENSCGLIIFNLSPDIISNFFRTNNQKFFYCHIPVGIGDAAGTIA